MRSAKLVALTVLVLAVTAGVACGGGSDEDSGPAAGPLAPSSDISTDITEVQERRAIRALTDYNEVADATLSQSGTTMTLVLVVQSSVSPDRAKELGDQFVRQVKFHGPDLKPIQNIGPGNHDYFITVTYPDDEKIAQGAKNRIDSVVTWE